MRLFLHLLGSCSHKNNTVDIGCWQPLFLFRVVVVGRLPSLSSLLGGFRGRDRRQELLEEPVVDAGPLQVHEMPCLAYAL